MKSLVEEQLNDGREWLFDTELPSFADISIHFIFNWLKGFHAARPLYDVAALPYTLKASFSSHYAPAFIESSAVVA